MYDEEWNKNIRETIKKHKPGTTDAQIDSLNESSDYWGNENYQSAARWIFATIQIIRNRDKFSHEQIYVNLFGTIIEIDKFVKDKTKIFSMLQVPTMGPKEFIATNTDETMREYFTKLYELKESFPAVSNLFTDDDKFLIGFVRHKYSHPVLTGYAVKIDGYLGSSKLKTANWDRLKTLASGVSEPQLIKDFLGRISPLEKKLERIHYLLLLLGGGPA